jgi:4-carboxymuconolactone decarboxylase
MTQPSTLAAQMYGDVAPKFTELTDQLLFDDIWKRPQLGPRDRSLATVSALIALYRLEQLPFHLDRALDNGVTREELAELVAHLAFYAGWPCAASATQLLAATLARR